MTVVALSASYGAGGSQIAPALADLLGVPFVDRAIPSAVADQLAISLADALKHDESTASALDRLLATLAPLAQIAAGASPVTSRPPNERSYVHATEQIIGHYADTGQAVILGRAATEILRDHPGVLRVRLDGSVQARTRQAMRIQGIDHDTAAHRRRQTDRARDDYLRHFYNADPHDASRYHLVLDTTAIDLDTCVQIIALAAESAPNAGAESTARDARTDHPTWRRPDAEQTDP